MFCKSFCKKVALLLTAAALLCGLAGCGKKETSSPVPESVSSVPEEKSEAVQSSETDSDNSVSSESQNTEVTAPTGSFDWDKALSEFYIDGIKIEYPFSESSLGPDFEYSDKPSYNEIGDHLTFSVDHKDCNGLWLFEARYKGVNKETYTPDLVPDRIYSMHYPSVQGIEENTSMEDVYALWGLPDEIEEKEHSSDHDTAVYYGKKDGQKLYLWYDNTTNKVELIEIDFTDMKSE